jgi:hypothetical protein
MSVTTTSVLYIQCNYILDNINCVALRRKMNSSFSDASILRDILHILTTYIMITAGA